jgi:hypothetical protein
MVIVSMLLASLLAQSASPQSVAVRGAVVRLGTDEPVAKAIVELRRSTGNVADFYRTTTGPDGTYVLPNVAGGDYQLTVTRDGYVRYSHGERKAGGAGTPVTIIRETATIRVVLTPTGVISGRIVDRQGLPLGNATVQAMKASFIQGRQAFSEVQSTNTNDLGEYRLFWLTPGKFYVAAIPTIDLRSVGGSGGNDRVNAFRMTRETLSSRRNPLDDLAVPIYFPGTTEGTAASEIEVKPGAEVRNIDIVAAPVRARHVRGVVISQDTGQPVNGPLSMRLVSSTGGARVSSGTATGTFDLPGNLPGKYVLGATNGKMTGRVEIEISDRDLDNVTIPVSGGFDIAGRLVVTGVTPANPGPDIKAVRVSLRAEPFDGNVLSPTTPATPAEAGTFLFSGVLPGTYRVQLAPVLQNGYLQSVKIGSTDGLQSGFTLLGPPPAPLDIVISARPGTVEGKVLNERQQPLPNTVVVLVPDVALRTRTDLFKSATSNASGEFKLVGLTPGNYKLFSWEEVEMGAWLNTEFMRAFEDLGRPVQVTEGSIATVDVRAVSPR